MKPIHDFIRQFKASIALDERLIVKKQNRYWLVNEALRPHLHGDFFYAGAYLGKVKNRIFFPSFILLAMMADGKANKTFVDKKTAWLFIVGRDVFNRGIIDAAGSRKKGSYTLVMNQSNECLGFGRIQRGINDEKNGNLAIRNIANIGDFLKREKRFS